MNSTWPVSAYITATAGTGKPIAVCSGIARNGGGWNKRLDERTSDLLAGNCWIGEAGRNANLISQLLFRKTMEPSFYFSTSRLKDILEISHAAEELRRISISLPWPCLGNIVLIVS
jgi:hypothetical protein